MPSFRTRLLRRHLAVVGAGTFVLLALAAFLGVKGRSLNRGLELLEWTVFLGALGGSAALAVHGARVLDILRKPEDPGGGEG